MDDQTFSDQESNRELIRDKFQVDHEGSYT